MLKLYVLTPLNLRNKMLITPNARGERHERIFIFKGFNLLPEISRYTYGTLTLIIFPFKLAQLSPKGEHPY